MIFFHKSFIVFIAYELQYYEGSSSTAVCTGLKMDITIYWIPLVFGIFEFVTLLLGFIFDILMIFLLRNLRRTQPIQLVPWKSLGKQEVEVNNEKISIPVRATLISFSLMLFTFFAVVAYIKYIHSENFNWIFCIANLFSKMKPKPAIPNRPIFHDCELDDGLYISIIYFIELYHFGIPNNSKSYFYNYFQILLIKMK